MKTLELLDGDLVIGPNGHQTVTGAQMAAQDLRCALGEPLGNDRFHPGYGSTLGDSVGKVLDDSTRFEVQTEVMRVVGNYSAIQQDRITRDVLSAARSRYTTDGVVADVGPVNVTAHDDALSVSVGIQMLDGSAAGVVVGVI